MPFGKMEQHSTPKDILAKLSDHNLSFLIRNILLLLDGKDLQNAKCVCKKWKALIAELLWNSDYGRKCMEEKLTRNWNHFGYKIVEPEGTVIPIPIEMAENTLKKHKIGVGTKMQS